MALCSANETTVFEAGIDILERSRIEKAINRYGGKFLNKIFTTREIENLPTNKLVYYSIGFSLKEAFWKTLPTKIQKKTFFNDIEIIWNKKKPEIFLNGKKIENLEVSFFFNKRIVMCCVIRHKKEGL
ncbi:MAG: 4'-phosphopantetheinyl transferase superfamily protein [Candidatus Omnitrophica bacterium]|nr:4'-phosphopantetheinyl transferase superfamily protein [Candidatus Omnitrophota bacterium]